MMSVAPKRAPLSPPGPGTNLRQPASETLEAPRSRLLADVDEQPSDGVAILEDEVARAVSLLVGGAHLEQVLLVQREGDLVKVRGRAEIDVG